MTEYPIFVPYDGGHLATIVTVPEDRPRGLVLLLQGLGAPRAHRYGMWARAARSMAAKGIAVARFDYPDVGDSTGSLPARMDAPPTSEALAVATTVMDATGVEVFGIVGNCLGARTAFEIAAQVDACVSAVSLGSPKGLLHGEGRTAPHRAARRAARKLPKAAKLIRRVVQTDKVKPRLKFVSAVQRSMSRAHVLFLLLHKDGGPALERRIATMASESDKRPGLRTEVQTIDVEGSAIFQLPLKSHQHVIDALVDWMDGTMPEARRTEELVKEG